MNKKRQELLRLVEEERSRQLNLPGSEYDATRMPNDWLALTGKYLFGSAAAKNMKPSSQDFQDDLVKAAAIIIAALEHIDKMKENNLLRDD